MQECISAAAWGKRLCNRSLTSPAPHPPARGDAPGVPPPPGGQAEPPLRCGAARAPVTQHRATAGTWGMGGMGPAEPFCWSLNLPIPRHPGMGGMEVNCCRDRTTGNYHLGAFSFLKLCSTPSQQGVCAHSTASSCLGLFLVAVIIFFPSQWVLKWIRGRGVFALSKGSFRQLKAVSAAWCGAEEPFCSSRLGSSPYSYIRTFMTVKNTSSPLCLDMATVSNCLSAAPGRVRQCKSHFEVIAMC